MRSWRSVASSWASRVQARHRPPAGSCPLAAVRATKPSVRLVGLGVRVAVCPRRTQPFLDAFCRQVARCATAAGHAVARLGYAQRDVHPRESRNTSRASQTTALASPRRHNRRRHGIRCPRAAARQADDCCYSDGADGFVDALALAAAQSAASCVALVAATTAGLPWRRRWCCQQCDRVRAHPSMHSASFTCWVVSAEGTSTRSTC